MAQGGNEPTPLVNTKLFVTEHHWTGDVAAPWSVPSEGCSGVVSLWSGHGAVGA